MAADSLLTLDDLRRFAVARSLFPPTSLGRAFERLGFVQADPIRAPARAQDLVLRHRVRGYRAGDLERRYQALEVEEDFFVNYGFVTRTIHGLMHPREKGVARSPAQRRRSDELLAFVRERGTVHPREVDRHFSHGSVTNYWGGSSSATTHVLDDMHYRGLLRVAGREAGIRLYAVREPPTDGAGGAGTPPVPSATGRRAGGGTVVRGDDALDALVDIAVALYAPVPRQTLSWLVGRLRLATPQWKTRVGPALRRATARLACARVDGLDWYWPTEETVRPAARVRVPDAVRLLAPFDPLVWDRRRFERFWGWPYRFEAYTPNARRKLGYYALPLLWRDAVIGWANIAVRNAKLVTTFGFVAAPPGESAFRDALEAELHHMSAFLGVSPGDPRAAELRAANP